VTPFYATGSHKHDAANRSKDKTRHGVEQWRGEQHLAMSHIHLDRCQVPQVDITELFGIIGVAIHMIKAAYFLII